VREDVSEFVNVQPRLDGNAKTALVMSFLDIVQFHSLQLREDEA